MNWKVLKSDADYQSAVQRSIEIFHTEDNEESNELDLLLLLIKDYEDKHIYVPQLTPAQLYRNKTVVIGLNGRKNSAMPSYRFAVRLKK